MASDVVILVGVDGSDESFGAVEWALARAQRTGARVHLVCAYSLPSFTAAALDGGYAAVDDAAIRQGAQAVLDTAMKRAEGRGIEVTSSLEAGDPAGVLVDLSAHVDLLVVGTRGGGGFAGRLLGTVSLAVPAHAHCPTVVVPRHTGGTAFTPVERIVVGVDGSDSARNALNWALGERRLWDAELTAVAAVPFASGAGALAWLPAAVDRDIVISDVRAGLERAVNEAIKPEDDGKVAYHALDGNAAELMVEFSTAVDLVIVGSRGRGGFSGLLLGSTSQAVLAHASCPVMVVPSRCREEEPRGRMTQPWGRR
ncbi:universal stress protein [Actinomyces vulturis]|uniref:universal stress protein n=1 Tax=Actinomyces vulturis TaxID=1857645 RepID=UPI00082FD7E4|nr:universal stress protein [Actinomyces vulturis]